MAVAHVGLRRHCGVAGYLREVSFASGYRGPEGSREVKRGQASENARRKKRPTLPVQATAHQHLLLIS
ncbi:hypothetical protein SKAU_G00036390 [Synaphobranchus kaupii]|uniref:Uncharacterized protein n=1 Tax=Synaphobranchus kaupii TaxID=118154 RepID=A0A9Q1GEM4_SYNKA|nr:hypothetical protein SKAU_G00036390 [Synaphobranchus kaupii]